MSKKLEIDKRIEDLKEEAEKDPNLKAVLESEDIQKLIQKCRDFEQDSVMSEIDLKLEFDKLLEGLQKMSDALIEFGKASMELNCIANKALKEIDGANKELQKRKLIEAKPANKRPC